MHVTLTPSTYHLAEQRAKVEGYSTVSELLTDLIHEDDFLLPTPALNAAIEMGLRDFQQGHTLAWQEAVQNLQTIH